jgi:hypothetical protein
VLLVLLFCGGSFSFSIKKTLGESRVANYQVNMPLFFRVCRAVFRATEFVLAWGSIVLFAGLCCPPVMRTVSKTLNEAFWFVVACDPQFDESSIEVGFALESARSLVCFCVRWLPLNALKVALHFVAFCLTQTLTLEMGYITLMLMSVKVIRRLDAGYHACQMNDSANKLKYRSQREFRELTDQAL